MTGIAHCFMQYTDTISDYSHLDEVISASKYKRKKSLYFNSIPFSHDKTYLHSFLCHEISPQHFIF